MSSEYEAFHSSDKRKAQTVSFEYNPKTEDVASVVKEMVETLDWVDQSRQHEIVSSIQTKLNSLDGSQSGIISDRMQAKLNSIQINLDGNFDAAKTDKPLTISSPSDYHSPFKWNSNQNQNQPSMSEPTDLPPWFGHAISSKDDEMAELPDAYTRGHSASREPNKQSHGGMFGRLFGSNNRRSRQQHPSLNDSIQQLRRAVTQLDKREVHLDKKIQECINNAKAKSKRRDKKGALHELKKKKQYEQQLSKIQEKKLNLETQIMTLEDAHLNKESLQAMKTSASAMRSTVKEADLDKADELMEDINETMDTVNEMNMMSQPLGDMIDDNELEAELAELEEIEADELLSSLPVPKSGESRYYQTSAYNDRVMRNVIKQRQLYQELDATKEYQETYWYGIKYESYTKKLMKINKFWCDFGIYLLGDEQHQNFHLDLFVLSSTLLAFCQR